MNQENKWMLMTYYCPTHGDIGKMEPIEILREDMSKTFIRKTKSSKDIYKS